MPNLVIDMPNHGGWRTAAIGDVCELVSRGTAPIYVDRSEVRAIGQRCVTMAGFTAQHARGHSANSMSNTLLARPGDVLLNSTGTGTIGRSCVFNEDGRFIVDGHVTALRPAKDALDSEWLNALLRSTWGQRHLERYCFSGSTNQVELNRSPLLATQIPLPPINEQRAFAKVLDTLDTTIRQTEAIIAKLKRVKQGLLHDLLTRGIDANGELRPPQSEAPHLYKASPLGWIPVEWDTTTLGRLSTDSTIGPFGSDLVASDYRASGVPVVFVRDVKADRFEWKSNVYVSRSKASALSAHEVRSGDVVATKMGLPPCVAAVYPESMPQGIITADIIRLRFDVSEVRPAWVSLSMNENSVIKQVEQITAGVTRAKVTLRDVRNIEIRFPPINEQDRILNRMASLDNRIAAEAAVLNKLYRQKSGLMDDLLTGRVRVTPLLEPHAT